MILFRMVRNLIVVLVLLFAGRVQAVEPCVQIFYDPADRTPANAYGRLTAVFLQNLLGHFPHLQQYVIAIDRYEPGQLERCKASLYLGTYFGQYIPETFLHEFTTTTKNVAWLGYGISELGADRLHTSLGARYSGISGLDWQNKDPSGLPGFYRYFDYKGERFEKYAVLDSHGHFNGAYELVAVRPEPGSTTEVLASSHHSTKDESVPYIIRNKNRFFIGDNPFSYMTEDDRYLIFADVLFDILGEPPIRPKKKLAFVRLEDVHSRVDLKLLQRWYELFTKHNVPHNISLIPFFKDPSGLVEKDPNFRSVPLDAAPDFVDWLKKDPSSLRTLILHGYTHQSDTYLNPGGASGVDFEFWDVLRQAPMAGDSPEFVLGRVESALTLLDKTDLKIRGWLTPHYAASALDHIVFGQVFMWNVGRTRYESIDFTQSERLPALLSAEIAGAKSNGERKAYFRDLTVKPTGTIGGGQFFPYEISGDYYGQRLIPEGVGFLEPGKVSAAVLLARAKRNLVLRDAWASFFVHPFLFSTKANGGIAEYEGDTREVESLFTGIKALGYEFVSLEHYARKNTAPVRKPAIELSSAP